MPNEPFFIHFLYMILNAIKRDPYSLSQLLLSNFWLRLNCGYYFFLGSCALGSVLLCSNFLGGAVVGDSFLGSFFGGVLGGFLSVSWVVSPLIV